MACQIIRDRNNERIIKQVTTTTGAPSATFEQLASKYGRERAAFYYSLSLTDEFKYHLLGDTSEKAQRMVWSHNNNLLTPTNIEFSRMLVDLDTNISNNTATPGELAYKLLPSSLAKHLTDSDTSIDEILDVAMSQNTAYRAYANWLDMIQLTPEEVLSMNSQLDYTSPKQDEYTSEQIESYIDSTQFKTRYNFSNEESREMGTVEQEMRQYSEARQLNMNHEDAVSYATYVPTQEQLDSIHDTGIASSEDDLLLIEQTRSILAPMLGTSTPQLRIATDNILKNIADTGIPGSFFISSANTLYRHRDSNPSDMFHEAFHIVWRTMLSDRQLSFYLDMARKEISKEELGRRIQELLADGGKDYSQLTSLQLEELAIEEYLADRFQDSQLQDSQSQGSSVKQEKSWLKSLFDYILNFLSSVFGGKYSDSIDALFDKINRGAFRSLKPKSNRLTRMTIPVFKRLVKGTKTSTSLSGGNGNGDGSENGGEKTVVDLYATEGESKEVVDMIAALIAQRLRAQRDIDLYGSTDSLYAPVDYENINEALIEELMKDRQVFFRTKSESFRHTDRGLFERFKNKSALYLNNTSVDGSVKNSKLIFEGVKKIYKALGKALDLKQEELEDAAARNGVSDNREMLDKSATERSPFEITDTEFEQFMALSMYERNDNGVVYSAPINVKRVKQIMIREFADKDFTHRDILEMMDKMAYGDDVEVSAFINDFKDEQARNPNILYMFKNAFNLAFVVDLQVIFSPTTGKFSIFPAMNSDVENAILDIWATNHRSYGNLNPDKGRLAELNESFDILEDKYNACVSETQVDEIVNLYTKGGEVTITTSSGKRGVAATTKVVNVLPFAHITGIEMGDKYLRFLLLEKLEQAGKPISEANKHFLDEAKAKVEYEFAYRTYSNKSYWLSKDFFSTYREIALKKLNATDREEIAAKYNIDIDDVRNPYISRFDNAAPADLSYEQKEHGMRGRLRSIAVANSVLDESYVTMSYQDSSGNQRYAYIQKSYISNFFRDMHDSTFRKSLIDQHNSGLRHNLFIKNPDMYIGKNFKEYRFGNLRQDQVADSEDRVRGRNKADTTKQEEAGKGVTSSDVDPKSFDTMMLTLWLERKTITNEVPIIVDGRATGDNETKRTENAFFYLKVNEVKNTDFGTLLPVNSPTGVSWEETTNKDVRRGLYDLFLQDFESIATERDKLKRNYARYLDIMSKSNPKRMLELCKKRALETLDKVEEAELADLERTPNDLLYLDYHVTLNPSGAISGLGRAFKLWHFAEELNPKFNNYYKVQDAWFAAFRTHEFAKTDSTVGRDKLVELQLEVEKLEAQLEDFESKLEPKPESNITGLTKPQEEIVDAITKMVDNSYTQLLERFERQGVLEFQEEGNYNSDVKERVGLPEIPLVKGSIDKRLYDGDYKKMIRAFAYSHYVNVTSFNMLSDKSGKYRKNFVDAVKRNAGGVAFGIHYEPRWDDMTQTYVDAVFAIIAEPTATNKFGETSDIADGVGYLSEIAFEEYMLKQHGRNPRRNEKIIQKARLMLPVSKAETRKLEKINAAYNSRKTVMFNSHMYHKLSYVILSRALTSRIPSTPQIQAAVDTIREQIMRLEDEINSMEAANWQSETRIAKATQLHNLYAKFEAYLVARPGYEKLHNIRQQMFYQKLDGVMPKSASKMATPLPATEIDGHFNLLLSKHAIQNRDWMLQTEVPTGKLMVTYMSQMLHIIDNELNDKDIVRVFGREVSVYEAKRTYRRLLGQRVKTALNEALKELGTIDGEGGNLVDVDISMFHEKLMDMLQDNEADESVLGFFRDLIEGGRKFKFNPNLPSIANKFEQIFLAHFSKGVMQQKVSGRKMTLVPNWSMNVTYSVLTGEVVRRAEMERNPELYFEEDGVTLKSGFGTRPLRWSLGRALNTSYTDANGDKQTYDASGAIEYVLEDYKLEDGTELSGQRAIFAQLKAYIKHIGKDNKFYNESVYDKSEGDESQRLDLFINGRENISGKKDVPSFAKTWSALGQDIKQQLLVNVYLNTHLIKASVIGNVLPANYVLNVEDLYNGLGLADRKVKQGSGDDAKEVTVTKKEQEDYVFANIEKLLPMLMGEVATDNTSTNMSELTEFLNNKDRNLVLIGKQVEQTRAEIMTPVWDSKTEAYANGKLNLPLQQIQHLLDVFGVRIPTQDKHSMISATVVDFLPTQYSDIIVTPIESMFLSGEDFDIDAKYTTYLESYLSKELDENGKVVQVLHVHGAAESEEQEFKDYLRYIRENHKKFNRELGLLRQEHGATLESYKTGIKELQDKSKQLSREFRSALRHAYTESGAKTLDRYLDKVINHPDMAEILMDNEDMHNLLVESGVVDADGNADFAKLHRYLTELKSATPVKGEQTQEDIDAAIEFMDELRTNALYLFVNDNNNKLVELENYLIDPTLDEETRHEVRIEYEDRLAVHQEVSIPVMDAIEKLANAKGEFNATREQLLENYTNGQDEIKQEVNDYRRALVELNYNNELVALQRCNLPTNSKDLQDAKLKGLYYDLAAVNNKLMELCGALYRSPSMVTTTETPASMTKIQGEKGGIPGIARVVQDASGVKADSYGYTTPIGMMKGKDAMKTGAHNIGIAAIANILKASLAKDAVKINGVTFGIDGIVASFLDNYTTNDLVFKKDSEGEWIIDRNDKVTDRIMDELSAILSAMTDNGKHNDSAKLNFTLDTLGAYCYLVLTGHGLNRVGLISKQPIMVEYAALVASKKGAFLSKSEKDKLARDIATTLIEKYSGRAKTVREILERAIKTHESGTGTPAPLMFGDKTFHTLEQFDAYMAEIGDGNQGLMLSSEMNLDALKTHKNVAPLDRNFTSDTLTRLKSNTPVSDLFKLYASLTNSTKVVEFFKKVSVHAASLTGISQIIRLHQGYDASFSSVDILTETLKNLGIEMKQDELGDFYFIGDSKKKTVLYDFRKVLKQEGVGVVNQDIVYLLDAYAKMQKAARYFFIAKTPVFESLQREFVTSFRTSLGEREENNRAVRNQLMSYIMLRMMKTDPTFNFDEDEQLMYSSYGNTIIDRVERIIQTLESLGDSSVRNNYLLQQLRREQNKLRPNIITQGEDRFEARMDSLSYNTRIQRDPDHHNRAIDAFQDLLSGNTLVGDTNTAVKQQAVELVQELGKLLFHYLAVKDGLLFRNNSFLRTIHPSAFVKLSNKLDEIQDAFAKEDWTTIERLTGSNEDKFKRDFLILFTMDQNNRKNMFQVNSKTIKGDVRLREGETLDTEFERALMSNEYHAKALANNESAKAEIKALMFPLFQSATSLDMIKFAENDDSFTLTMNLFASLMDYDYSPTTTPNYLYNQQLAAGEDIEQVYKKFFYIHLAHGLISNADAQYFSDNGSMKAGLSDVEREKARLVVNEFKSKAFYGLKNTLESRIGSLASKRFNAFRSSDDENFTGPRFFIMQSDAYNEHKYGNRDRRRADNESMLVQDEDDHTPIEPDYIKNTPFFLDAIEHPMYYDASAEKRAVEVGTTFTYVRVPHVNTPFSIYLKTPDKLMPSLVDIAEHEKNTLLERKAALEGSETANDTNTGKNASTNSLIQTLNTKITVMDRILAQLTSDNTHMQQNVVGGNTSYYYANVVELYKSIARDFFHNTKSEELAYSQELMNRLDAIIKADEFLSGTSATQHTITEIPEIAKIFGELRIAYSPNKVYIMRSEGSNITDTKAYRIGGNKFSRVESYGADAVQRMKDATSNQVYKNIMDTSFKLRGLMSMLEKDGVGLHKEFTAKTIDEGIRAIAIALKHIPQPLLSLDTLRYIADNYRMLNMELNKSEKSIVRHMLNFGVSNIGAMTTSANRVFESVDMSVNTKAQRDAIEQEKIDNAPNYGDIKASLIKKDANGKPINGAVVSMEKVGNAYIMTGDFDISAMTKALNDNGYMKYNKKVYKLSIGTPELEFNPTDESFLSSTNANSVESNKVLEPTDYVNHSGGAIGADIAWDTIGHEFGVDNHRHYWMSEVTPHGNAEITPADEKEGQAKVTKAARQMGRIEPTHQVRDTKLIRNWSQVKYADAVFAITTMLSVGDEMNYGKKAKIRQGKGGTGYAIQMAINEGKPVYVFDQVRKQWFKNIGGKWLHSEVPVLTKNFAGIGTREINQDGRNAIRDVYAKTFGKSIDSKNQPKTYHEALQQAKSRPNTSNIPQNLVSGVESFGTLQEATDDVKAVLGDKPHSIDMINAGLRTRTTRTDAELAKYNIKVGDYVMMFGASADGSSKNVLVRITDIYNDPQRLKDTWYKEGWTQEGFAKLSRFKTLNAIEFEVVKPSDFSVAPQTTKPLSEPINIYSTDKSKFAKLSNLHNGPITTTIDGKELTFKTVEHAYQATKALFASDKDVANAIYKSATGWDAQRLGKTIKGLDKTAWDSVSSGKLEELMRLAFEQNPEALKLLMETGDAQLTHKAGNLNLGKWETVFPSILMRIRAEHQPKSEVKTTKPLSEKEQEEITHALTNYSNEQYKNKLESEGITLDSLNNIEQVSQQERETILGKLIDIRCRP